MVTVVATQRDTTEAQLTRPVVTVLNVLLSELQFQHAELLAVIRHLNSARTWSAAASTCSLLFYILM